MTSSFQEVDLYYGWTVSYTLKCNGLATGSNGGYKWKKKKAE